MEWTEKAISEWHRKTFPNETLEGQLLKMNEELLELRNCDINNTEDFLEEIADCLICASALSGRFNSPIGNFVVCCLLEDADEVMRKSIGLAVSLKMKENLKRTWKKKKGVYRHDA